MLISKIASRFKELGALDEFWNPLNEGQDGALGVAFSARAMLTAARFSDVPIPTLVVVPGDIAASNFAIELESYLGRGKVFHFPQKSNKAFECVLPDAHEVAYRCQALHALESGENCIVVASSSSQLQLLPPKNSNFFKPLIFSSGDAKYVNSRNPEQDTFDFLVKNLCELGYVNTGVIDGVGTFSVSGGTIDIFPGNLTYPIRLDFFGDELEEIRRIVPSTGQSFTTFKSMEIFPVQEIPLTHQCVKRAIKNLEAPATKNRFLRELQGKLASESYFEGYEVALPYLYGATSRFSDYISSDTLSVLVEPRALFDDVMRTCQELRCAAHGTSACMDKLYLGAGDLSFGKGSVASFYSIMKVGEEVSASLQLKRTNVAGGKDILFDRSRELIKDDYITVFSAPNYRIRQEIKRAFLANGFDVNEILEDAHTDFSDSGEACKPRLDTSSTSSATSAAPSAAPSATPPAESGATSDAEAMHAKVDEMLYEELSTSHGTMSYLPQLLPEAINIVDTPISLGMVIPKAKLALISTEDLHGMFSARPKRRVDITEITFSFKPGDYVVHSVYGVAFFKELKQRDIAGRLTDYAQLVFANDESIFCPVESLDRVTKYVGPEGNNPRLSNLKSKEWARSLKKARSATRKLAFDLIDVYTRRACTTGYRYGQDTSEQIAMEKAFPFKETPDQLAAIEDVKSDMQTARPMDRLVCGDVGFGKTEVAMRAAFKATQDGKQVMVLCPTTILAQQHYSNFNDRFKPFGLSVKVLSRFVGAADQKATIKGFAKGDVNVLIGTHRLLSRDINPADLGLVIIDEEQRFGVGHRNSLRTCAKVSMFWQCQPLLFHVLCKCLCRAFVK